MIFSVFTYLTTTTYGDSQNIVKNNRFPENIKIDKDDVLLIHTNIGTYNLHLITPNEESPFNCVNNIIRLNSKNKFKLDEINIKLQESIFKD